jgi:ubiquinone/menaquinone biosynthesis C-methylase UbiE
MWKGLQYKVVRCDLSLEFPQDTQADFGHIPFRNDSFDVVVFDPPHLPTHAASKNSSNIWKSRYGITDNALYGRNLDNVSGMFLPFLTEAHRILKPNGIILAKIADITHNHTYQWQHVDFIHSIQLANLTPCDLLIKVDPNAGNLKSSKWTNTYHLRKAHSFWIVARNGNCEKPHQKL